jgi:hypothetical protein
MRLLDCNEAALLYWKATKYTPEQVQTFLEEFDTTRLAARITFRAGEGPLISISKKSWETQSGHYSTITNFFGSIAKHPIGSQLSGSIVIWLDDGIYGYESHHFMRIPTFSFSRSIYDNHTLLIPDPAFIETAGYAETLKQQSEFESHLPFQDRLKTIFWRGAASGIGFSPTGWKQTHRGFLTLKATALNQPTILDAAFTKVEGWSKETIASIEDAQVVSSPIPFFDFLKYRYLVDADGITCAWISYYRKLASQSVTLKMMGENTQWYYHLLKPWKHYVPMRADAEDVELIYEWLIHHPHECRQIIENANSVIASIRYEQEVEGTALLIKELLSYNQS